MPGVVLEDTDRTLSARELCPRRAGACPNSTTFCRFLMAKVLNRYRRKINRDLARGRELHGRRDGRRDPERHVPGRSLGREPAESRAAHVDGSRAGPDGEIAAGRNLERTGRSEPCRRPCPRAVARVVRRDPPADREPELRIRRAAGLGHRDLPPPGLAQQARARPRRRPLRPHRPDGPGSGDRVPSREAPTGGRAGARVLRSRRRAAGAERSERSEWSEWSERSE